jgi:glycosyltransferase involved in cell wall biosynthesis
VTLLFVANFGRDVGYAWHTITAVYRGVGARLAARGVRTLFCYPDGEPGEGRVVFDYTATRRSLRALLGFIALLRRERVRVLYLTDLESWSWRYPLFHLAGVAAIVVHDRTSGARASRLPVWLKHVLHRCCGADLAIGISRFVVNRLVRVNGVPAARATLVYNGIEPERFAHAAPGALAALVGVPPGTRVVLATGRAQPYKGIPVFIEAAARLEAEGPPDVAFAYCGDGPALAQFRDLAAERGLRRFHFLGRRDDVPRWLGSAALAVVPATWDEAFGLTVVEAMAAGVPVVATRVGAIPEVVEDGVTGVLVAPGDADALARAIAALLADPSRAARLANGARAAVRERFIITRTTQQLADVLVERVPALTRVAAPPPRS